MNAIAQTLTEHVPPDRVYLWDEVEANTRQAIEQAIAPGCAVACVAYPQTMDEMSAMLRCAEQHRWRSLPFGKGTKLKWGGLATEVSLGLSTARLNRLIDHAVGDLTITVEAGMTLQALQTQLATAGQWLPIDPSYSAEATLGGIVATADAGALRHRYGGIRDLLIGLTLMRADGNVAKAGGRVVKNVAGYDLMKLFTGSWGTLGLICEVTVRVYPLPDASETVVLTGSPEAIASAGQTLLASALTPTAVELLAAPTVAALGLGTGMGLLVRFQSIPVSVEKQAQDVANVAQALGLMGDRLTGDAETTLWKQLQESWEAVTGQPQVTCKIGVLPSQAVTVLDKVSHLLPSLGVGLIHAGSGLGVLRCAYDTSIEPLLHQVREVCQAQGGFLSLLEAPLALKQRMDVWGYSGDALWVMQGIKQRFDPNALLSPSRFVSGI